MCLQYNAKSCITVPLEGGSMYNRTSGIIGVVGLIASLFVIRSVDAVAGTVVLTSTAGLIAGCRKPSCLPRPVAVAVTGIYATLMAFTVLSAPLAGTVIALVSLVAWAVMVSVFSRAAKIDREIAALLADQSVA